MKKHAPTLADVMAKLEVIERLLKGGADPAKLRCLTSFVQLPGGEAFFIRTNDQRSNLYRWARKSGVTVASAKVNGGYIVIRARRPRRKRAGVPVTTPRSRASSS